MTDNTIDLSNPGDGAPGDGLFWALRSARIGSSSISYSVGAMQYAGTVKIHSLRTSPAERGRGSARSAMTAILDACDAAGLRTVLDASPLDRRTHGARLIGFYRSLGYELTGRTINPVLDPEMSRPPGGIAASDRLSHYNFEISGVLRGSHHGQNDHTLTLKVDGEYAGHIDYSVYNGTPAIEFIKVAEDMRRRGCATRLIGALQSEFPEREIEWGFASTEGAVLRASLPKTVVANETVITDIRRLQNLREQRDALLRAVARFRALESPSAHQRATYDAAMTPLNDLHDAIADLEVALSDAKLSITLIDVARIEAQRASPDASTHQTPTNDTARRRMTL